MPRAPAIGVLVGLTLTLALSSTRARAEAPSVSEQMLAQSLFEDGRQLMDRGKYAEACPKLAESQRLDPGGGTLLNLAICHEKEGRFGTAYLEMKAASSQAGAEGRKDREKIATEHLGVLAARVPRLAVHVVREEADLEVKVDGTTLRKPAWDLLTVVDPGKHVIDATAPGRAPFRQTITLAPGEQRTFAIPALSESGASGVSAPTASVEVSRSAGGAANAKPETKTNPLFIASIATGVTGFTVGLPAAYVWTMLTITSSACSKTTTQAADGIFCASDGTRSAWLAAAVVGLAVGVVGTIGIVVFPRKVEIVPTATASGAGALIIGSF